MRNKNNNKERYFPGPNGMTFGPKATPKSEYQIYPTKHGEIHSTEWTRAVKSSLRIRKIHSKCHSLSLSLSYRSAREREVKVFSTSSLPAVKDKRILHTKQNKAPAHKLHPLCQKESIIIQRISPTEKKTQLKMRQDARGWLGIAVRNPWAAKRGALSREGA